MSLTVQPIRTPDKKCCVCKEINDTHISFLHKNGKSYTFCYTCIIERLLGNQPTLEFDIAKTKKRQPRTPN